MHSRSLGSNLSQSRIQGKQAPRDVESCQVLLLLLLLLLSGDRSGGGCFPHTPFLGLLFIADGESGSEGSQLPSGCCLESLCINEIECVACYKAATALILQQHLLYTAVVSVSSSRMGSCMFWMHA